MSVEGIVERLRKAEDHLAREADTQQRRWRYGIRRGHVWFDEEVRRAQRAFRQSIPAFIWESSLASLVTAPVLYSLLLPFVVLDAWVTLYQWLCFPIYGIAHVPRGRGAHRTVLVPDQARAADSDPARPLSSVLRLRRRKDLSPRPAEAATCASAFAEAAATHRKEFMMSCPAVIVTLLTASIARLPM